MKANETKVEDFLTKELMLPRSPNQILKGKRHKY